MRKQKAESRNVKARRLTTPGASAVQRDPPKCDQDDAEKIPRGDAVNAEKERNRQLYCLRVSAPSSSLLRLLGSLVRSNLLQ